MLQMEASLKMKEKSSPYHTSTIIYFESNGNKILCAVRL